MRRFPRPPEFAMHQPALLCVARHGETDWNTAGILQGWIDVPLNDEGRRQSLQMARDFADQGFGLIYTSPLRRSAETAEIIARELALEAPRTHDGIMERNFGALQGVPKAQIAESDPALMTEIFKRNPAAQFAQGETMDEFADRVLAALSDIAAAAAGRRALLITHGWVMDVITRQVRGLPRDTQLNMKRKNGECLWIEATPDALRLREET